MSFIPKKQYTKFIEALPILCVDIILRNSDGEYLLVKRANEPLKGQWWVIGGRVLKNETLNDAVIRKTKQEIGLNAKNIRPIGYFELTCGKNPFGLTKKYHTISIVFLITTDNLKNIKLDNQSTSFKFAKKLPADFLIKPFNSI